VFTGLVMAGRRPRSDALAGVWGEQHRALVDVNGVPMLLRVVRAMRAAKRVGRLLVSIDEPEALEAVPELRRQVAEGELIVHASRPTPSRSVLDVLEGPARGEPVLVATADHALLTAEMIDHFAEASAAASADVLVGLVAEAVVRARYPDATRTFLRLRGGAYKGANLFAFRTPTARRAAAFWVRAEQFRKQPWRLVRSLGPTALLLFWLRRLDLDAAFDRLSRAAGAQVAPIPLPYPEAAIDVDRPADLALVCRSLARRPGKRENID
jgi:GTP:adenosylcobinamide-phosphate guanylyltransferase